MSETERLAAEWLQYALDDLSVAEGHLESETVPPRYACYQSQQAAEKAIKALLVEAQVDFRLTHDLEEIARQVDPPLEEVTLPELADLTRWATQTRYPSEPPAANAEDATRAVDVARSVVTEAKRRLRGEG